MSGVCEIPSLGPAADRVPADRSSDCVIACFFNTVLGNATTAPMPKQSVDLADSAKMSFGLVFIETWRMVYDHRSSLSLGPTLGLSLLHGSKRLHQCRWGGAQALKQIVGLSRSQKWGKISLKIHSSEFVSKENYMAKDTSTGRHELSHGHISA